MFQYMLIVQVKKIMNRIIANVDNLIKVLKITL